MQAISYEDALNMVQKLTEIDQLRLLEDLASLIRQQVASHEKHSIIELQGLGKEIWAGVDIQEYLDAERSSWAG